MSDIKSEIWCNICEHSLFENSKGVLCSICNEKPNFTEHCAKFSYSESKESKILSRQIFIEKVENDKENGNEYFNHLFVDYGIKAIFVILTLVGIFCGELAMEVIVVLLLCSISAFLIIGITIVAGNERGIKVVNREIKEFVPSGITWMNPIKGKIICVDLKREVPEWKQLKEYEIRQKLFAIGKRELSNSRYRK